MVDVDDSSGLTAEVIWLALRVRVIALSVGMILVVNVKLPWFSTANLTSFLSVPAF